MYTHCKRGGNPSTIRGYFHPNPGHDLHPRVIVLFIRKAYPGIYHESVLFLLNSIYDFSTKSRDTLSRKTRPAKHLFSHTWIKGLGKYHPSKELFTRARIFRYTISACREYNSWKGRDTPRSLYHVQFQCRFFRHDPSFKINIRTFNKFRKDRFPLASLVKSDNC